MSKIFPLALTLLLTAPLAAQAPGAKALTAAASVSPKTIARGGRGVLTLTLTVAPHFHINAVKPNDPALIPTEFKVSAPAGVKFGPALFPAARTIKASYSPKPMLVYMGRTTISIPFTVSKTSKPGRTTVGGTLGYQGCNETSCFPPASVPVRAVVIVK